MKKQFIAAALAGVVLLSGCSGNNENSAGSSPNAYNSSVEKSSSLQVESRSSNSTSTGTSTSSSIYSSANSSNTSGGSYVTSNNTSSEPQESSSTQEYKKDVFTVGATKCDDWYYKETETGSIDAVLYVNDYNKLNDVNDFVTNFYTGMYNIVIDAPHHGMYVYWVLKENGSLVATTFLMSGVAMPVVWMGDYEPLNNNEIAKQYNDIWCNSDSETSNSQSSTSQPTQSSVSSEPTNTATTGERNAVKKAQSYLDFTAFSRDGLIDQLEFEGFTTSEATYGADNVGANWNEQAVKKAKSYLDTMSFSYKGIIEQLEYEEFTHEQAVYGADKCGADWNEQAVKKAKSYLEMMAFSKEGLIEQLEFEGFAHDQAVYGAEQNGY